MNLQSLPLLLFLIIGFCNTSASQSNADRIIVKGKIIDYRTTVAVPYVNVYYLKSNSGTSADAHGNFSIQVHKQHSSDTLIFSTIGYKILKKSVLDVLNSSDKTFYLEEDVLALDEVTISAMSAVEIIKRAMKERKNNYGVAPYKLSGIYRITDQEEGAYVRLLEAAVDIYDPNYLKKNSRVVDYLALRQSKDFRTFKWKTDKFNARNVDELLKPDLIKRPTRATHSNGFDGGFFYAFEKYALLDNEPVYIISAKKNTAYQWPNYNASFYVRARDFAILRVDRDYNIGRPNWAKAPNVTTNITTDQLVLKYKEVDGKLYLNYFLWNLKGAIIDAKSGDKLTSFERNEELNIHNVTLERPKKNLNVWDADIYKMTESYNQEFWENYPVSNTELFVEVTKELEERQNLNDQFLSSDNKYDIYNPGKTYKVKDLKQDFRLFQKSLEEGHPSLYRYTSKSDFLRYFDSTYQSLTKPLTEIQFYRLLTPLIAKINCGHTQSLLSEEYYKFHDHREFYFPLQTKFLDGKLYVSKNYFSKDTVFQGSEILSVDGEHIKTIKETLDKHLSSDGYIQTSKDRMFGRNFSSLYALYYDLKDDFSIRIKTPSGQIRDISLSGISFSNYLNQREKYDDANRYDKIRQGVGLMKVGSFIDREDQDFKRWVKNSFEKIRDDSIKNLIIDLRGNGGGRDDYAIYLYSFLASNPFSYHRYLESATNTYSFISYTDQDSSLNRLMRKIVQKDSIGRFMLNNTHPTLGIHENRSPMYSGEVFFLINGNTFSAAADFSAIAKQNQRGNFIGEETGGAAIGNTSNGFLILTLPNTGICLKIPQFKIVNAVDIPQKGRGVFPDYETKYNYKDIMEKRDNELELVLSIINSNAKDN